MNKLLLHIEGLAVFVLSIYFYFYLQFSWLLFAALLFAPDISAIGYIKDVKIGSLLYNLFHTYTFPLALLTYGFLIQNNTILMISLIWIAHIGLDRMLGFGLKYPTKFQDTHLNRI